jgi:hypothetical protein
VNHTAEVTDLLDAIPDLTFAGSVDGRRTFVTWRDGAVRLLDDRLSEIGALKVELPQDSRVFTASGLGLIALDAGGTVAVVFDGSLRRMDVVADAAVVLGDALVLAVPGEAGHRLLLLDPATGEVADEQALDGPEARAHFHPHPEGSSAVLGLAMGQDGTQAYGVDVVDSGLQVREILPGSDPVVLGFAPTGDRLLVAEDPSAPETLLVLSWPGMGELVRIASDDVEAESGFGLAGCWIDEERIALYATEDALLVADAGLNDPVRVDVELDFREDAEIERLVPLGRGGVAAAAWTPEGRITLVAEFPSA